MLTLSWFFCDGNGAGNVDLALAPTPAYVGTGKDSQSGWL